MMQIMFGWECHPYWYKIAHIIELFIMDAFVDLFITLCIVVNTVFMALDHANMEPTLAATLKYGNYVSRRVRHAVSQSRTGVCTAVTFGTCLRVDFFISQPIVIKLGLQIGDNIRE